jgi:translation elongation factor EF-1alpha
MPKIPESKVVSRQPVIAVVGHVDHGKSSLLDFIRKSNMVSRSVFQHTKYSTKQLTEKYFQLHSLILRVMKHSNQCVNVV